MLKPRLLARGLSALLAVSAMVAVAAVSIACDSGNGSEQETRTAAPTVAPSGPPPHEDTMRLIEERSPSVASAIAAVESGQIEAILGVLHWEQFPCTNDTDRGGVAPRCSELGVPQGTPVEMFHYQLTTYSYFTREQMRERLERYLVGRSPELALAAVRANGSWLVSFTIDERGGDGVRAIDFEADPSLDAPFTSHKDARSPASTPLDTLHEEEYIGGAAEAEIIYTSPAMEAWEAEKGASR